MTFQLLMMASDGWLLASDTRLSDWFTEGGNYSSSTKKIVYADDAQIAYGYAGDHLAQTAGKILVKDIRKNQVSASFRYTILLQVGHRVLKQLKEMPDSVRLTFGDSRQLLVLFMAAPLQGSKLEIPSNGNVTANQVLDHIYSGARTHALLLPQLFGTAKNLR